MQLFIKRVQVVSSSGKHALLHLDPSFMSDREDEGSQTGSWIGRSPLWCSPVAGIRKAVRHARMAHKATKWPIKKILTGPVMRPDRTKLVK